MFKKILFLVLLIIGSKSKEFILKKNTSENNEFTPYMFNFTLADKFVYPSIFDTTNLYIIIDEDDKNSYINSKDLILNNDNLKEKEIIINDTIFKYKINNLLSNKGYFGIVGLSNKDINIPNINITTYSYLKMLEIEEKPLKYVNFIQKGEDEAIMKFGDIDSIFNLSSSSSCKCIASYWSCQISFLKIGGRDAYIPKEGFLEHGIFSISEEYIIVPKDPGMEIIKNYIDKIKELFGIKCNETIGKNNLINITCDYFNYQDLPDISFVMNSGTILMALSIDLFKILNHYILEFKVKYNTSIHDKNNNYWYLGEPVIKNYNFLLNYTDKDNIYLIIIPSSLNGFILIIVACVGGFLFLFIFLTCIYCISKKENKNNKREKRHSYFSEWLFHKKNSDNNFKGNYIMEKIYEEEDENNEQEDEELINEEGNNGNNDVQNEIINDLYNDNLNINTSSNNNSLNIENNKDDPFDVELSYNNNYVKKNNEDDLLKSDKIENNE